MNDSTLTTPTRGGTQFARRPLALLLIVTALLAFAPVIVLGPAIGWPASLATPAAAQLNAIHAHAGAVTLGYGLYLAYSLLLLPASIGLTAAMLGRLDRPLAMTAVAFASLATLARALGILRWLTVMPDLAARHVAASAADRATHELVFDALTRYGGGIGEVLGVSLLTAIALAVLGFGALRLPGTPRWQSLGAIVLAVLIGALSLPTFRGPALVPIAAAVSLYSAWLIAGAILLWRSRPTIAAARASR